MPYKEKTLKPQSYTRLESTVDTHIIPEHGMKILNQVTSNDINLLIEKKQSAEGLSHSSIKKIHDAYSAMFKFAVNMRDDISYEDNPMKAVVMPSRKSFTEKEIQILTPAQIIAFSEEAARKFATGAPVYRYGMVFLFILNTGIREGEFCALEKDDIDFEKKIIHIHKNAYTETKKDQNGEKRSNLKVGTPKNRNSIRYVPMSEEAARYARALMQSFPNTKWLASNLKGDMVRPDTLYKEFNAILRNMGASQRGLHTLRHTFVSALFENGVDLPTIAEIIGDTEDTVKKTYLHLYKERKARAVKGLNIVATSGEMVYNSTE